MPVFQILPESMLASCFNTPVDTTGRIPKVFGRQRRQAIGGAAAGSGQQRERSKPGSASRLYWRLLSHDSFLFARHGRTSGPTSLLRIARYHMTTASYHHCTLAQGRCHSRNPHVGVAMLAMAQGMQLEPRLPRRDVAKASTVLAAAAGNGSTSVARRRRDAPLKMVAERLPGWAELPCAARTRMDETS